MTGRRMGQCLVAVGLTAPASTSLLAHMPYVLPSAFEVTREPVTLSASFGEDAFRPEIEMKDASCEITAPDGRTVRLAPSKLTGDLSVVEAILPVEGLYRVSSGQRLGRMAKMYRTGKDWTVIGEGVAPPPGTASVDVSSAMLADAYVLRGKAGAGARR